MVDNSNWITTSYERIDSYYDIKQDKKEVGMVS
jgi:hypothetical protein